jgi:hypothetical protein
MNDQTVLLDKILPLLHSATSLSGANAKSIEVLQSTDADLTDLSIVRISAMMMMMMMMIALFRNPNGIRVLIPRHRRAGDGVFNSTLVTIDSDRIKMGHVELMTIKVLGLETGKISALAAS